jgi:glutamate transport system substrate-binding protein
MAIAGITAAMAASLAGCGQDRPPRAAAHSRFYHDLDLRIGVHSDQPGIGLYDFRVNKWSGLDITVADYVLTRLGIPFSAENPHIYTVDTTDRDKALLNNTDDLVIASYSITDGRIRKGITFTIPYLLSYQDILIRGTDAAAITSVDGLRGRKVCTGPSNGTPYEHLAAVSKARRLGVIIKPEIGSWLCVDMLLKHRVDAVVSDNAILFGYQRLHPALALVGTKVWPRPEQYGIGFIAKTPADVTELNAAIRQMITDGSWAKAIVSTFCPDSAPGAAPCRLARTFLDNPPPTR